MIDHIESIRRSNKNMVYGSNVDCAKCKCKIKYNEGFSIRGKKIYHFECSPRVLKKEEE